MPTLVQAFWGDRPETTTSVAGRLAALLASLDRLDPTWEPWVSRGRAIPQPLDVALTEVVDRGVNRRDSDGAPIENLGYSGKIISGGSSRDTAILFACGGYDLRVLANRLVIRRTAVEQIPFGSVARARGVAEAVITTMQPDHLSLMDASASPPAVPSPRTPRPGWLIYLSKAAFLEPPSDEVEEVDGPAGGWLHVAPTPWTVEQLLGRGSAADFAVMATRRDSVAT